MLVVCWSPKGGSGTTVVAALIALACRRTRTGGALLVDVAGDLPAALGVPEPSGPGLSDWLGASAEVDSAALSRLEVDIGGGLSLLPGGTASGRGGGGPRAEALAAVLTAEKRLVVADCGHADRSPGRELAAGASLSLCVLRPCYLGLRRALAAAIRPSGVVLVREPGRALRREDVEDVLGVPVWAEVPYEESLARAVDAGLLSARTPRAVDRVFRQALSVVAA